MLQQIVQHSFTINIATQSALILTIRVHAAVDRWLLVGDL